MAKFRPRSQLWVVQLVPFVNMKGDHSKKNWNIKGWAEQPLYWKNKGLGVGFRSDRGGNREVHLKLYVRKTYLSILKREPSPYLVMFRNQTSPELEIFDSIFLQKINFFKIWSMLKTI